MAVGIFKTKFRLLGVFFVVVCFPLVLDASSDSRRLFEAVENGDMENVKTFFARITEKEKKNSLNDLLSMAVQNRHAEIAKFLVGNGAEINAPNYTNGGTLLHRAFYRDAKESEKIQIIGLLISCGADVNASDHNNATPLHLAAERDYKYIAEMLISSGAFVNVKDVEGNTPLRAATMRKFKDTAKYLVSQGADVDIFSAVFLGDKTLVKKVLTSGNNINIMDKIGYTPLAIALMGDSFISDYDTSIIDLLINSGANINVNCPKTVCGNNDNYKYSQYCQTPLHHAVSRHVMGRYKDDKYFIKLLIDKGADVNASMTTGTTALSLASSGHFSRDIARLLIDSGANINSRDCRGITPLHVAVSGSKYFSKDTVKLLLARGADVNAEDQHGQTPLHTAVENDDIENVILLAQNGADVDAKRSDGMTPLQLAAKSQDPDNREEIAETLIEYGANISATQQFGYTPLHWAARYEHIKMMRLLIQHDADINARDKGGLTPLHRAVTYNRYMAALFLIGLGAEINIKDSHNETPLNIAKRKGYKELAGLLRANGAKK